MVVPCSEDLSAFCSTLLGFWTMACVTPGATERNWVGWDRFSSVNVWATEPKSPFAGAGLPKKNGRMLLSGMVGGPPGST